MYELTNCVMVNIDNIFLNYQYIKNCRNQILGLSELNAKTDVQKDPTVIKPRFKRGNIRETYHEVLQRIDSETDVYNHYQQHWFSASLEVTNNVIIQEKLYYLLIARLYQF